MYTRINVYMDGWMYACMHMCVDVFVLGCGCMHVIPATDGRAACPRPLASYTHVTWSSPRYA